MKKRWMSVLTVFSMAAASASVIALTYAAYITAQQYTTPLSMDTTAISAKFAGGTGTSTSPFLISSATHLRNLQKLNELGVFTKSTYFQVSNDITYSGTTLAPIGSDDFPFYSQFDGNGYTISSLSVTGPNTADIGFFGYVAHGGTVKNLILSAPIINVTANNTGTSTTAMNANPMYSILNTAAGNLANLGFTNATPASFTVPATTITGTDSSTYTILYESSDTSLLYNSSGTTWQCVATDTSRPSGLHPVQLTARVFAYYNGLVVSYTLERWQINVRGDGAVAAGSSTTNPGYFKLIHSTTLPHETYAGVFIGHLDGDASYLGLYGGNSASSTANGKIIVTGRNARSYSMLIGISHLDNPYDDSAVSFDQQYLDFNQLIPAKSLNGTSYAAASLTDFTTQNSRAVTATTAYGISSDDAAFFRFYPYLANTTQSDGSTTYYVQRYNTGLGTSVRSDYKTYYLFGFIRTTGWFYQNFTMRNGIWLWLNAPTNPAANAIFSSDSFEVKIHLTYIATGTSTANRFQIMTNQYNPSLTANYNIPPDYVRNTYWTNLGTSYDSSNNLIYDASQHPLLSSTSMSGKVSEQDISITIDRTTSFWDYVINSSTYYPMLAIGVGKNTETQTSNTSGSSYRYYYSDFSVDTFTLNIIKMQILYTSKDGDVSAQVSNVDYLYQIPTRSSSFSGGTYTAWNKSSNVKVQFNVSNYAQNTNGTTYAFYRDYSTNLVYTNVHVLYTTGTSFAPTNTDPYDSATLTATASP